MLHQINYRATFEHYFIVILICKHCQSAFKGGVWNDLFETEVNSSGEKKITITFSIWFEIQYLLIVIRFITANMEY